MSGNEAFRGVCPVPFYDSSFFTDVGFYEGRLCEQWLNATCCLPCPMTDWVYPDNFATVGLAAEWVAVVSTICCVGLLISWAVLPVDKTHKHYLSICLTTAVLFMNMGFVIPLAARPDQCYDLITPNSMNTNSVCAASGAFLIIGGWGGVLWVCLRSLSLHLQICWQVVVGRNFMWFAQATGWGIPVIGIVVALVFSGVSFRFGATCHINHLNSLSTLWIPLLVFAGLTIIIQFATFGYCIKVYLVSLADSNESTEQSGLPSYTNSIRTMTPKQAYRRVRRVIQLQWRGIAIVLIIVADVIFFAVVFVFLDNTVLAVSEDPTIALSWIECIVLNGGDKNLCLDKASSITVNLPTVGAVLVLLAMNGIWLVFLLGRWTMVTGWCDMVYAVPNRRNKEFVSADARLDDVMKDTRSYEMLSRDSGKTIMDDAVTPTTVSPVSPTARFSTARGATAHDDPDATTSPIAEGRRTPDYFGPTQRYHAPARSFSNPKPPQAVRWDSTLSYAQPMSPLAGQEEGYVNPLGLNRI